jgi:hypothetical protein
MTTLDMTLDLADMINVNEKAKRLAALMMNEIVKRELSVGKNPMAVVGWTYNDCSHNRILMI